MSSSFGLLGLESFDFSQDETERTAWKAGQIHKISNYFPSKWQPCTILSENISHIVNSLSILSSSFILSMWKITWLNSQQPKTKGHVEHPIHFLRIKIYEDKNWDNQIWRKKVSVCFFKMWMASNFLHDDRLGLDWAGKYPLTNQSALCAFRQVCSRRKENHRNLALNHPRFEQSCSNSRNYM